MANFKWKNLFLFILKIILIIYINNLIHFCTYINLNNENIKNVYKENINFAQAKDWKLLDKWIIMNKKEKLDYYIDYNVGLNINAKIGDFADYNSDVKTDLILYKYNENDNTSTIYIYIFDTNTLKFIYHSEVILEGIIENLMAIDINFDGMLDILALFKKSENDNKYYIVNFIQNEKEKLIEVWNSKKKEESKENISDNENFYYSNIHPLIYDINGDGYPDLICQQNNNNDYVRFIYINDKKNGFQSIKWNDLNMFEYENDQNTSNNQNKYLQITHPHSSAIVDLNGDCKSDLVFIVYTKNIIGLEIWLNLMKDGKGIYKKLNYIYELPHNPLQILFGDFNADGSIDLIVPTCDKKKSDKNKCIGNDKLYFIPNIQKKLCDKTWKKNDESKCRPVYNLCYESEFKFVENVNDAMYISLIDESNFLHFSGNDDYPNYISIGDIDNDGYPDLLICLRNEGNKYVRIYKNEFKNIDKENDTEIRGFYNFSQFIMTSKDSENRDIYNAAFFDIYENGILDILIFGSYQNSEKIMNYSLIAFVRTNETDSLFLKSTALNGVCINQCYINNHIQNIHAVDYVKKKIGVNSQGPTFKITVININGVKTSRIGIQRFQSSHFPLQLPYVIFGLGRTNNYVEEFYLGMPIHENRYYNMWVSIIPNSHIIVIPYPLNNPNEWKIQLSVNPSKKIYSIIYITLICLIAIGLLIFILDRKEKIEDSKEEKGFKSHFVIR